MLGDSDGSRLYWALVDPGLADEADLTFWPQDQTGAYFAYASCDAKRADEVERILLETIDKYVDDIHDDEIERAKNKLATQATLQGENPNGRMRGLGGQWTYQREYRPLTEELAQLMAVTVDDVRSLIKAMPFQPRTIVRMTPGKNGG